MTIARDALYFEDYVLSIQYFNQVINAKPYLYEPYFFRGLAKINLDDYQGAEADCSIAIQKNPFVVGAYLSYDFALKYNDKSKGNNLVNNPIENISSVDIGLQIGTKIRPMN